MTKSQMLRTVVGYLAGLQAVCPAPLPAQRPVDISRGSVTAPMNTRAADPDRDYRLAVDRFRSSVSLTRVLVPATGLGGVDIKWAPHPGATRYRVLRGPTGTGPWMPVHEDAKSGYTLEFVPRAVTMFIRIIALRQEHEKENNLPVDTTYATDINTYSSFPLANGFHGVPDPRCSSQAPLTAVIHWPVVPLAAAYLMQGTRRDTLPSVQTVSGLTQYFTMTTVTAQTVRDTVATYTSAHEGTYFFKVQARFDFPDWNAPGDTLRQLAPMSNSVEGKVAGGLFTCR